MEHRLFQVCGFLVVVKINWDKNSDKRRRNAISATIFKNINLNNCRLSKYILDHKLHACYAWKIEYRSINLKKRLIRLDCLINAIFFNC